MVFHQVGPLGLGTSRIPEDMRRVVIEELVERAGLDRKAKGQMQVALLGQPFEVVAEQYDSFGESAFNLTIRKPKKKRR